jgi:alpha-glucoside transport system substrate-binding protein
MMPLHTKIKRNVALVAALGLAITLGGCATEQQASSGGNGPEIKLDPALVAKARDKAASIVDGQKIGGSLEIINENGGREGAILQAAFAPFTEATGVTIKFTGTSDFNSIISSRLKAGNPPDIGTQNIGAIEQYLRSTKLLNLSDAVGDETLQKNFSPGTLDSLSVGGKVYGMYQGFNNYMLWYNPQNYDGPKEGTWADVQAWTEKSAASGKTPWCIAEESGPATGAVGTQWIEELFVKKFGPEKSKDWGTGKLPWTSPEVKSAFEMFGAIAAKDAHVNGGVAGSLSESTSKGSSGLVAEPAKCSAVLWGTWTASLIAASSKGVEPGKNLDFVRVPASDPKYANTEAFRANPLFAFNDTPATRAFMKYIASAEEQTLLASADNWVVSNTNVPATTHSSPLLQKVAKTFFGSDISVAVGPGSLAPAGVKTAFWQGVVTYLKDPSSLDTVLARIQQAQTASAN